MPMIAKEIPAAINPYSMAVAPDSFFRNLPSKSFTIVFPDVRNRKQL
jgi:hypothetical protein